MVTSDRTIQWIENLAEQESKIFLGELNSLDLCHTKESVLKSETTSFLRTLYYQYEYLVRLFNARISLPIAHIRLEKQSGNFDVFALTRNGMRLTVNGAQSGAIHLQCARIDENSHSSTTGGVQFSGRIEAKFEAFHEVVWYFLDSRIDSEQLARHYLTEFLQVSRLRELTH